MNNPKITHALNAVYSALHAEAGSANKVSAGFVSALSDNSIIGDNAVFNSLTYGITKQSDGTKRNIGVYISGDNMYDADFDGSSRVAIVVDILLKNEDASRYARYADAMVQFLEGLNIGLMRRVINISFSQPSSENNLRITEILAVEFESESDGGADNGERYI